MSSFTELDVSHNRMSALPAEVSSLTQLESVDIGHNSFVVLPDCLFQAPRVTHIDARKNFIAGTHSDLSNFNILGSYVQVRSYPRF